MSGSTIPDRVVEDRLRWRPIALVAGIFIMICGALVTLLPYYMAYTSIARSSTAPTPRDFADNLAPAMQIEPFGLLLVGVGLGLLGTSVYSGFLARRVSKLEDGG